MKHITLRILLFLLVLAMLIPMTVIGVNAEGDDVYDPTSRETQKLGATFDSNTTAKMEKILPSLPYTYEAEIQLSSTNRGGVILGNYSGYGKCISFEIHEYGRPRIYAANGGNSTSAIFNNVSVISSEVVRVSITVDTENNMAHCYLNGELKQSLAFDYDKINNAIPEERPLMVGGDYRSGNSTPFLGQIKSVYAYSDVRTSEEIAQGPSLTDENLLVAYDFMSSGNKNLSGYEGYNLTMTDWKMDIAKENALTFTPDNTYQVMKPFDRAILTYEAQVYFPTSDDTSTRGGVVLGNYYSTRNASCVNFEFKERGAPRLYFEINGAQYDFHFSDVDARLNRFVFVTITLDPTTGEAKCYLDGELKQTINKGAFGISNAVYSNAMYLGRDARGASGYPFNGALKSLAVYSDIRTADEIKADMTKFNKESEDLLAMYEFSTETGRSDISGNCYHICYDGEARPEDTTVPSEPETPDVLPELNGLTFTANDFAVVRKKFKDNYPYTFEATVFVENGYSERAGVILGNHNSNNDKYLSFEIYENGVPRLCFSNPTNTTDVSTFDYKFTNVHVNTGVATHVAITLDPETGTAICYINGEAKQTITRAQTMLVEEHFNNYYLVLGNDPRANGTSQHFKGIIGNVTLYSDKRSADEIKADYNEIDLEDDNILLHYDLSNKTSGNDIADLSGNGYTVKYGEKSSATISQWISPSDKDEVGDYLYSFAVVGDTQIIARKHPESFHMIYDWILSNQTSKNIQYVFGLGDITDANSSAEWAVAKEQILRMNGKIPYSVVRGNHDGITQINNVFANDSAYMSQFIGFYAENDMTNSYRTLEIADTKYLLVTLDYGASDAVLNWAGDIIDSYADHKVIITTHAYLYRDGTTLDSGDVCPPATNGGYNNGDHMWDKLISQHENIFLVISGHDPSAQVVVTQTEGIHGNIVTQMLVDPQGVDTSTPTGMVTMLYFKADGSIEVETYSTIQESYYKESNQFVIRETEHDYKTYIVYAQGFDKDGEKGKKCTLCGAVKSKEIATPLFVALGYSIGPDGYSLKAGFNININLLNEYKQLYPDFSFGMIIANANTIASGESFFVNELLNSSAKGVMVSVKSLEYTIWNIDIDGFNPEFADSLELVVGVYTNDGEGNMAVCQHINADYYTTAKTYSDMSLNAITFNQVRIAHDMDVLVPVAPSKLGEE